MSSNQTNEKYKEERGIAIRDTMIWRSKPKTRFVVQKRKEICVVTLNKLRTEEQAAYTERRLLAKVKAHLLSRGTLGNAKVNAHPNRASALQAVMVMARASVIVPPHMAAALLPVLTKPIASAVPYNYSIQPTAFGGG